MPGFREKKNIRHAKRQDKKQSEDTKQTSEPDLDMKNKLELTDMINMLRALMEQVDNISWIDDKCKQRSGNSTKYQKEILEIKTTVTNTANERISECKDRSREPSQTEMQK